MGTDRRDDVVAPSRAPPKAVIPDGNAAAAGGAAAAPVGQPPSGRVVTWDELRKHKGPDSLWVAIHGFAYDVTKWADTHPGGCKCNRGGKGGQQAASRGLGVCARGMYQVGYVCGCTSTDPGLPLPACCALMGCVPLPPCHTHSTGSGLQRWVGRKLRLPF